MMTVDWEKFTTPCNLSLYICKSFIWDCFFSPFSSHYTEFSLKCFAYSFILKAQIKAWEEICMYTALTLWSPAQLQAACAVSICLWHVCIFAAELTKLWPWHSLCWILLQVECRNYIRTLHRVNDTAMYVCGTNAFSPTCDYMVSREICC